MRRTLISVALALVAGALWLLWSFEHEHTTIRAPWTGLTYAASAAAFVAVGVIGRGWRAAVFAAAAAAAASILVDPLVWRSEPVEPGAVSSCDPGCISRDAAVMLAAVAGATLACLGVLLRRAVGRRSGSAAAAPSTRS